MLELLPLPYDLHALAPHLGAETLELHHGRHQRGYVEAVNKLVVGTPRERMTLEELVLAADGALFDAAAQTWNHEFYWKSMRPGGGGEPTGAVAAALREHFGSFADFRRRFKESALARFGSGWIWLVQEGAQLRVTSTANADLPLKHGQRALLTCDVWEHAYYLDYQNARASYVDAFLDHLVDWSWVAKNLR
jgi:Fe-Mn family superoxide dismutase